MRKTLHVLAIGLVTVVYAFLGLLLGVCTGFLVLKIVQVGFAPPDHVMVVLQWLVIGWSVFVAVGGAVAYLRSSRGERFVT